MLIGVDIGGTKCAVIAAKRTETGVDILAREAFATAGKTPQAVIERFDGGIRRFTEKEPCEAIGISCGGPLDSEKGVILSPPNLPGWDHIEITRHFSEVFGVPVGMRKPVTDAGAAFVTGKIFCIINNYIWFYTFVTLLTRWVEWTTKWGKVGKSGVS